MSKQSVYLNCSEIASFIGQNKWDYVTPYIRLWKRVDKDNYNQCEDMAKNNEKTTIVEKVTELQNTLGDEFVNKIINSKNNIIENVKESHIFIDKMENIDQEKKVELKNNMENLINTNFGTNNECGALELYEIKNKVILNKSQEFKKKECHVSNKYTWYIGGKVDGILNNDKIIEVKTRTRCFFKDVREYENTQMQMYMNIYDINKTDLVEFLPQNKTKIKITTINKDPVYINKVFKKIKIFIENFENFVDSSIDEKYKFYNLKDNEKKEYLSSLYIDKMYY